VSNVLAVRQLLEQRYPDATPLTQRVAPAVPTGLAALDEILPGGGLPRGKLTAWHTEGGAAAMLRVTCRAVTGGGERAAWIDGTGPLGFEPKGTGGTLIVRPTSPRHALRSAEVLLRSGGLALVVLAGAEPDSTAAVWLARAAREGGAALVTLARQTSVAGLRVSSRFLPHGYSWAPDPFGDPAAPRDATIEIRVRALGWNTRATIVLPVMPYELRLSSDPGLADRRGSERRTRRSTRR
jgi:hypothetical protein